MRKLALISVMCVLVAEVSAQSHSFRDTTYVRYQQFDFDAWMWEDTVHHGKVLCERPQFPGGCSVMGYDDILQYNYTDNPAGVEVFGLSAVISISPAQESNPPAEYLLMYEATPDSFVLRAQVQWDETDWAGRPCMGYWSNFLAACDSEAIGPPYYTDENSELASHYRYYDFYFDKPIIMYDSFYVGGTDHGDMLLWTHESGLGHGRCNYVTFNPAYFQWDDTCVFPALWKIYSYRTYDSYSNVTPYQWYWRRSQRFLMVLPIIAVVDTSFANAPECPRVTGLFSRGSYTDTVTVQWAQDSLHREFEVSYGREGTAPDDGTIVTVRNANRWQFTDVACRDIPMVSYVRTVCREYDTLRWSGWSSPVRWRLHHEEGDTTHHEGIEVAEGGDLSRFVRLMPNPASGSVLVMSSYGMERVEVYDTRGSQVHEQAASGTTTDFDVSGWAKGAYVVIVHTPKGIAAKRLVVQ